MSCKNPKEGTELKKGLAGCYLGIGLVHWGQGSFEKALEYIFKSLRINKELGNKTGILICCNDIGCVYRNQQDYNKASEYYNKSLKLCKETGNKTGMSLCYGNLGLVHTELGNSAFNKKAKAENFDLAIEYFSKSLKISEEIGNKSVSTQNYICIGNLYSKLGNHKKAIEFCDKGIELAKTIGELDILKEAYLFISGVYANAGEFSKAYEHHLLYSQVNDSVFKDKSTKRIAEMQTKYENAEKEKENELLKKDKTLKEAQIKRQNILIYSIVSGFVLMFVLAFVIFRSYRQKKKANTLLAFQKAEILKKNEALQQQQDEILQQNEEIKQQTEEILTQRDLLSEKNDELSLKNQQITDSIEYAQLIQNAILPNDTKLKKYLKDYFILYKPKDIVGGDFYWFSKHGDNIFVAAADCTGHGVPGGFMSMLGYSSLNNIINEKRIYTPSEILENLNLQISAAFQQDDKDVVTQDDGMDITLCCINKTKKEIQIACANQNAYLAVNNELKIIKGDIYSIGDKLKANESGLYTNQVYPLTEDSILYLSSDGYQDQFGGTDEEKFSVGRFLELLETNHQLPMEAQLSVLNSTFIEWKGHNR
ncbi:MAG: tetratricopeptide repeat protein [Bacteroidetes bacterium]|nr:tetratricopeptide repeat protein [Bacteroidota bacterium]